MPLCHTCGRTTDEEITNNPYNCTGYDDDDNFVWICPDYHESCPARAAAIS
jgi:hypothetical protein